MSSALTSTHDVVADLSELHYADSSMMLDLAMLAGRLRAEGRTLRLQGARPHVEALIDMVGLSRLPAVSLAES
jgi:anti-anti-sigma regulatory factor